MVVRHEVTLIVAHFPVPDVDAVGVQAEPREMEHVGIDGLLAIHAELPERAIRVSEWGAVVDAELRDLRPRGRPPHDPVVADRHRPTLLGPHGREQTRGQADEREWQQETSWHRDWGLKMLSGQRAR